MFRRSLAALAALAFVVAGAGWYAYFYHHSGAEVTEAAGAFLAALTPEQKAQATADFDDARRVDWHFIPKPDRKGLQVKNMTADQKGLAYKLLQSALSQVGYEKAQAIMSLEGTLAHLERNRKGGPIRDGQRYYLTVFGAPDVKGRWGLSFEGHHLSLNFVITEGKVTANTPAVFAANPATIMGDYEVGPAKGARVLKDEEDLAFQLLHSFSPEQAKVVVIAPKAPDEVRAAGAAQPPQDPPVGLAAAKMTDEQRELLLKLITTYTGNMPADVAEERKQEIEAAGVEKIHFAWAGADRPGVGHYYRVQGPTFLLEFANVQPDAAGNVANHIHSYWRNMQGDFGISVNTPHSHD